jgi:hypothetical protein
MRPRPDDWPVPKGMICRVDRRKGGGFWCVIGWPTPKGNFSAKLGKWHGFGADEGEAVDVALRNMKLTRAVDAALRNMKLTRLRNQEER